MSRPAIAHEIPRRPSLVHLRYGFGWSPTFLSGSVILCGAVGLLLSFVALPPVAETH